MRLLKIDHLNSKGGEIVLLNNDGGVEYDIVYTDKIDLRRDFQAVRSLYNFISVKKAREHMDYLLTRPYTTNGKEITK